MAGPFFSLMVYRPKDAYYQKAKREGYRSRAAYKLLELDRRFGLIRRGDRVVDLGAAPGGWLQVAGELTGPGGRVVGVDLQPIEPFAARQIAVLQADIGAEESLEAIAALLGGPADCVLSDLSPKLSGIRDADLSRSAELCRLALEVASRLLKPGGSFLAKTFVGGEAEAFFRELRSRFSSAQRTRPDATRKGSSEIYLCAKGFQPGAR